MSIQTKVGTKVHKIRSFAVTHRPPPAARCPLPAPRINSGDYWIYSEGILFFNHKELSMNYNSGKKTLNLHNPKSNSKYIPTSIS